MSEVTVSASIKINISMLVPDEFIAQGPILNDDRILELKNSITNSLSSYFNNQSITNITVERI